MQLNNYKHTNRPHHSLNLLSSLLQNIYKHNNHLCSIMSALQQQIDLVAALAAPEQRKNISETTNALYNGLEEISMTVGDLKDNLKKHVQSTDKQAKGVEKHSKELKQRTRELDARVISLPAIEHKVLTLGCDVLTTERGVPAIECDLQAFEWGSQAVECDVTATECNVLVTECDMKPLNCLSQSVEVCCNTENNI